MPPVMPRADSRARAERVAYLRANVGLSWSQIAAECGFTSVGAAQNAYKSHRRRNPLPGGEAVLADLVDRQKWRNQQGVKALLRADAAGDNSEVASLIRALAANDADLAKWFDLSSETVNVNVSASPLGASVEWLRQIAAANADAGPAALPAPSRPAAEPSTPHVIDAEVVTP